MISVLGAGAFGTALAVVWARAGREVTLWSRDPGAVAEMRRTHRAPRLPDAALPDSLLITDDLGAASQAGTLVLAVPMQALSGLLPNLRLRPGQRLVAACKGIDLGSNLGPTALIARAHPDAVPAILTGPSFAADIARDLPTALTLACRDEAAAEHLQKALSTPTLRLYRSPDPIGAELGGALKNVVAIACGAAIGAGLGDSARAALMTRGFAEMRRLAAHLGADPETLAGLSGLGDLALTCGSDLSRNFRHGQSLGSGGAGESGTVEGVATARAVTALAGEAGIELPIAVAVDAICSGKTSVSDAITALLARPLKEE
ncbi:NAD(P)H-dependent glycerol-3-phosphate dehydrogenase [Litorisediminicola beolgyonensis]|uniref:Glycerol-3-phosphate dehydrogenase [NAD(P)+] n=1 Tax=Litorisediminicola beolgyonensis TaxID=1173614 RepID=A0ABW3ZHM3_9RHOB